MKFYSLLLLIILVSCGGGSGSGQKPPSTSGEETTTTEQTNRNPLQYVELVTEDDEIVKTSLAYTAKDQTAGLQNVREDDFSDDQGKLFFYLKDSSRTFWMPNTYFNLDLIYLDQNLKVIDIVWNLQHYTGNVNSEIPRAPAITSRHVLEMKAGSPLSSKVKIGDVLRWKSVLSLEETETKIRKILSSN